MKLLIALAIAFSTTAATAFVGSKNTWEEIFKAKSVSFLYEENLGNIDFRNACLTPSEIRSIKPMRYCPKLVPVKKGENKDRFTDWVCEKWETGIYRYPRTLEYNYCREWTRDGDQNIFCKLEERRPYTIPQTIKVRIVQTMGSYSTYPGFSKEFTLPNCQ